MGESRKGTDEAGDELPEVEVGDLLIDADVGSCAYQAGRGGGSVRPVD